MTDELFQNIMNHIEDIVKKECPFFLEKQIDKNREFRNCNFLFQTENRLDIEIVHNGMKDLFSIEAYLYEENGGLSGILEAEDIYLLIKEELVMKLRNIKSYRLQLLCSEETVIDDVAKETIQHWKS